MGQDDADNNNPRTKKPPPMTPTSVKTGKNPTTANLQKKIQDHQDGDQEKPRLPGDLDKGEQKPDFHDVREPPHRTQSRLQSSSPHRWKKSLMH